MAKQTTENMKDATNEKQRDPAEGQELSDKDIDLQLSKQQPASEKSSQPTTQLDEAIEPDSADELSDDEKGKAA